MDLTDQIVVVTGGASGLGLACVDAFLEQSAHVVVWDRQLLPARRGAKLHAMVCSVDSEASVLDAMAETLSQVGCPRILVQCAGILGAGRMVSQTAAIPMSLDMFQSVIHVNLVGTFNVMRVVAAQMMTLPLLGEERGVIINTASIAAFEGQVGQLAYSASKGGVVSMTLPAARELSTVAIRVNTIAPGLMETPMLSNMPEKVQERLHASCVFPSRLGKPAEFASLARHLIENPLMNGEVVRLDGAIRLNIR